MIGSGDRVAVRRRIMVVGLGNPDRGDDGIGAVLARRLAERLPEEVTVLLRSGDLLALIEDWKGFDVVICIDAAAPMGRPGRIHRIDLTEDELPRGVAPTSSHAFGFGETVDLARALHSAPPRIIVYAIEGSCFDAGAAMTPEVAAAAAEATDRVAAEIDAFRRSAEERLSHA